MKADSRSLVPVSVNLVSFDVFDTMLARKCGPPEAVFRIAGEKLLAAGLVDVTPGTFQRMRGDAERRARRHHGPGEITLDAIYAELNAFWHLPAPALERMIACEIETEAEQLFPVPGALEMVRAARGAGKRIAFLSDMYLPGDFIGAQLSKHGMMQQGDRLYVSSKWGGSKADGELYHVLIEKEKLLASEVVHIGDSAFVDYRRAIDAGLGAIRCSRGALNRYESHLAGAEGPGGVRAPELAGIARMARLEADPCGRQEVAVKLGGSIAGPILTMYAEWVLRRALADGVKRLFFLARDGQAILELCRILAPALGARDIGLHYLYGSREVWYPAPLLPMDDAAADFFASQVTFTAESWEQCVGFLGFKAADFAGSPITARWPAAPIPVEGRKRVFLDLVADRAYGPTLRKWLTERVALGSRYLREAGLTGGDKAALVDSGWSGTWTDIMADLVEQNGGVRPEVFFLGRRRLKLPPRTRTHCFLFDQHLGAGLDAIPAFFHVVIEFLLTADHGRTTGFALEDGKVVPLLGPVNLQGFTEEEWRAYRGALVRFAQLYAIRIPAGRTPPDFRRALVDLVALLWERPSSVEAQLFGRHAIGLSPTADADRQLARPYTWSDLSRLCTRFRLPGFAPHWWHEGALALTPSFLLRVSMAKLWQLREIARALHAAGWWRIGFRRFTALLAQSARRIWWAVKPLAEDGYPHMEFAKRSNSASRQAAGQPQEAPR